MDNEETIYNEFAKEGLSLLDACERLQKINYTPKEAEELVWEWAEGLDNDQGKS